MKLIWLVTQAIFSVPAALASTVTQETAKIKVVNGGLGCHGQEGDSGLGFIQSGAHDIRTAEYSHDDNDGSILKQAKVVGSLEEAHSVANQIMNYNWFAVPPGHIWLPVSAFSAPISSPPGAVPTTEAPTEPPPAAAPYVYGSEGTNTCPLGYMNVLTAAKCQAAALQMGLVDQTASDESHTKDIRPKGCFHMGRYAYLNPNTGTPQNPQTCQACKPICSLTH